MDLKRNFNESEEAYLWRIGQLVDSGQIDNWSTINNTVNSELGIDETKWRDESSFRKRYQAAKKFYDNVFISMFADNNTTELSELYNKIKTENYKKQALNLESNRLHRQMSRYELFAEQVANAITSLPLPELLPIAKSNHKSKKEYVLTISDIHYGACFDSLNNSYSPQIAKERFKILLEKTYEYIEEYQIEKIKVVELGDCIQGILRISDLKLNESTVVQAVVEISRLIAEFLRMLSSRCYVEYYHVPSSNHTQTRNLGTKASELASEDLEYVIGNYIKDSLANNDRVIVNLNCGKDHIFVPIFDFNVIALHGHTIKNINTAINDLSSLHRMFIDYVLLGHYHERRIAIGNQSERADTEVLISPSFIGSDPYSESLYKSNKPACLMYQFDQEDGLIGTFKMLLS